MDDLVREFIDETVESLAEMDMDLVTLEQDPNNQELLGKVFRLMHTIKGTCGFIGLQRLEKTAHSAENLLDGFRNGSLEVTTEAMTLIFEAIDRIRMLVDEVNENGVEPEGSDADIISKMDKVASGEPTEASAESFDDPSSIPVDNVSADDLSALLAMDDEDMEGADKRAAPEGSDPSLQSEEAITIADDATAEAEPSPKVETPAETAPHKKESMPKALSKEPEFLRVQMSVLEELINMVSELVLTRNQLMQMMRTEEESSLKPPFQRLNRIVSDLQDSVMKTRMQPIQNAWSKLPRIVRDLANESGKKINLDMQGGNTELDRQVLDLIKDPLTHMIRNSCDHGIESPQERKEAGKPDAGTIHLNAYHEGGFIVISIKDDGKGLNPQKILNKAIEKGLVTADKAAEMSEKQILSYIMKPGFSTAEKITNVSGRGVGMDVVRSNIEKIGGSIDMDSTMGGGTSFTIQIPLTLAIISALIFEIDGHRYAIPQMNIQELVSLNNNTKDMVEYIKSQPVLRLRDRIIPLLDSRSLFELSTDDVPERHEQLIVVINIGSSYYGIIVDKVFDTEEVVIKSVSSLLKNTNIFAGNTILGDGRVIMILDPAAIARKFNVEKELNQLAEENKKQARLSQSREEHASMLVFKAGEGAMKAIPLAMVSRLHVFEGKDVTISDDKVVVNYNDSLMQLSLLSPKSQRLSDKSITSLIIADDRSEAAMGLVIDEVVDIIDGKLNLSSVTTRDGIIGSMILGDLTVDVIDVTYFLSVNKSNWFSQNTHAATPFVSTQQLAAVGGGQAAASVQPVSNGNGQDAAPATAVSAGGRINVKSAQKVLVVDDSSFFRNLLYPILTSAGYRVTLAEEPAEAIKMHDDGAMFDIIISDIEMPNMNGYEFVEKMRSGSNWQDLPFVAITSHNTPEDAEYGYKMGFNKYIGKFNRDELLGTLKTVRNE